MTDESKPSLLGTLTRGGLVAVAAWIAYSRFGVDHAVELAPAIDAEQVRFRSESEGFISYYADTNGSGRPLVLIHSVNAAASAYEMRPIFERYRGTRPVYAIDLPGFGFSERADSRYSPAHYTGALLEFMQRVATREDPADVIALSLGSEFAARAAVFRPQLFRSLTLISPSGLSRPESRVGVQTAEANGWSDAARAFLGFPLWSQAFFDLLATPASIRWFLQQSFFGDPDPGLVEYAIATAHQPGARFAPVAFVSGGLFSPDVLTTYLSLTLPTLVLYDRDPYVKFDALPMLLREHPNWFGERITPTRGLPQFERMDDVAAALDKFWTL